MAEINVHTENIPQHVSDMLCESLLGAVKRYLRQPGAREKLIARAKQYYKDHGIEDPETSESS